MINNDKDQRTQIPTPLLYLFSKIAIVLEGLNVNPVPIVSMSTKSLMKRWENVSANFVF